MKCHSSGRPSFLAVQGSIPCHSAEKAILADDHCRTNVANVYAAGDCAAVFDPLIGKHRILDHWDNAQVTGRLAGLGRLVVPAPLVAVAVNV